MKIGFFITARLKSSRLKRKVLLDLNGKTLIDRVIERAKKVNGIDGVVLCTSTNPQDSELYKNALLNNIQFYAGSEDDVLQRLYSAARYYGYDAFLSITADNPLHSFYYGSKIVDISLKNNFDFIFPEGLPLGIAPYYIKTDALEVAVKMKKKTNTEVWGPFVNRPDFFNICNLKITSHTLNPSTTRLTCDYQEDYQNLIQIYSNFNKNHIPSIFEIEKLINENEQIGIINNSIQQLTTPPDILSEIKKEFDLAIEFGKDIINQNEYKILPGHKCMEI